MIIGIYFSGTGNSRHAVDKLVHLLDEKAPIYPLEDKHIVEYIKQADTIYFSYPTQFSNAPIYVRDFIKSHDIFKDKKIFCICTMGAFSGDGSGCTARLFKKKKAKIIGGLHLKMVDSVCDSTLLKKSDEVNKEILRKADFKIEKAANDIKNNHYPKQGLSFFSHMLGLFGQRLWFYHESKSYSSKLTINPNLCIGCGLCSKICPLNNITMKDGKPVPHNHCTKCYRCISHCPKKAITLLGKEVVEQTTYEKFASQD